MKTIFYLFIKFQENVTEQTDTIVDDHNMDTEDDANRPSAPGQPRTMENIVVHTPQLVQPPVTGTWCPTIHVIHSK